MAHDNDHGHKVPLWALFLALLTFTALEVGFYEYWRSTEEVINGMKSYFIPKYVMVLVILIVLTLPKALIVLIYFMHLKFEKVLLVYLAIVPFLMAPLAVVPTMIDGQALAEDRYSHDDDLGAFSVHHHGDEGSHEEGAHEGEGEDAPGDEHETENDAGH